MVLCSFVNLLTTNARERTYIMSNNYIEKMKGYKATDATMCCSLDSVKFQYELGKWYEHEGDIRLCSAGFHFCVHPSGPYSYYSEPGTRIFEVEAEQVLETPIEAGADFKRVAKRIRLVKEITAGARCTDKPNDGWNTGTGNTGDRNTGDRNTGTGNTGVGNTGDGNTGDGNTGYGNATNNSSGFFCAEEPKVISFDVQTNLTQAEFLNTYPEAVTLGKLLMLDAEICFDIFSKIPGITVEKLKKLHQTHLAGIKKL